jgi:ABC-type multidrug transport system fused ATPase/permease subunit
MRRMMFWLLALVLLASLAGVGYRQGAIRVAFSFVGILIGALLAGPLGKLVKPLLVVLGLKTPPLAWWLAPLIVFVVISIIFKVGALVVHKKVDVHFRYHAGDLRQVLWERLNRRLGLCLALANGALYLILLSSVIYPLSYWTVQMATEDKDAKEDRDPKMMRILNRLGQDLQNTRLRQGGAGSRSDAPSMVRLSRPGGPDLQEPPERSAAFPIPGLPESG